MMNVNKKKSLIKILFLLVGAFALRLEAFKPYAELTATSTNIVLTETAQVSLSVYLPLLAIKEIDDSHPPFVPKRPPHVVAPFLSDEWSSPSIEKGDVKEMLQMRSQGNLGFTLNSFASDPFESMMSRNPFESMFENDPFESFGPKRKVFPVVHSREEIDGTNIWRFVLSFPPFKATAPGKVKIEGVHITVPLIDKLSRDRYGRPRVNLKEILLQTKPIEIEVVEPPFENRPKSYCGAIGSNVIVRTSLDSNICTAGDPIILSLAIEGMANQSSVTAPQFAELSTNSFFKIDKSSIKTDTTSNGRLFTWRMRVLKAGTIEFPSLEVAVYDLSKREYKVIKTQPIPIQVKAGAQIALQVDEHLNDEIPFPFPDGIILDDNGWKTAPMFPHLRMVILLILVPPFFFLFCRFAPSAISAHNRKRKEKRKANAFNKCRKILIKSSDVKRKERAVREFLSVRYEINAAAATAFDVKALMDKDFSYDEIRLVVSALEEVDTSRYSSNGGSVKILPFLIAFTISVLSQISYAAPPQRVEFSWQRASSLAINAEDEKDFLRAAQAYQACILGGSENPVAYYNYASCMLMAGKASKAYDAFSKVERFTGETESTLRGLKAARARLTNDPRAELSMMRTFFKPHFKYSLDTRVVFFSIAWAVLWVLLLLPKGAIKRFLITLTVIVLTISAVSVSFSIMSEHLSEEVTDVQL
jgi:hypothetical protein